MKTCTDLHHIVSFDCCDTCHADWRESQIEMCHVEIAGVDYHVCCAGAGAYYGVPTIIRSLDFDRGIDLDELGTPGYELMVDNIGIAVSLPDAYAAYFEALDDPAIFALTGESIAWFEREGLVGWWRHHVVKYLQPKLYRYHQQLCQQGRLMRRQTVLNAVLDNAELTQTGATGDDPAR